MRVLQFRMLCDTGGVSSVMLLQGRELERRGIANEFWFVQPSRRLPDFTATGRATLGSIGQLARRLERGDVDVIHLPSSDPAGPLIARIAGRARLVVTGHGALADNWHHGNCFGYTAVSAGTAALNQPLTDVEIAVVRNAIDTERFGPDATVRAGGQGPIIAFVGRTTPEEKDFPRFTRVLAKLADRGVRVWIADPHEGGWEQFAGREITRIPTERWAPVAPASMPAFYHVVAASGGAVLLTSATEGFGMAAAEAAACGARVIGPDQIGVNEAVIDGVTGTLYPATASDGEVADRVRAALARAEDSAAVARAAREAFSPARMSDGYLRVYEDGCPRRTTPAGSPEASELTILRAHLAKQRGWRAAAARQQAPTLAAVGRRADALWALGYTARTDVGQFATRPALRNLWATARALVRPARVS